jgi:chorismate-pyruvate lyase
MRPYSRRLIITLPLLCGIATPHFVLAQTRSAWPDTFLARVEAFALIQTLNANLLAARSATFTLDKWCAEHHLANGTYIRARLLSDVIKPITEEQRRRLQIKSKDPVKFRHVELICGDRVLSEADNWYVPSRLTAEMNRLLETTDISFGRAVADLKPFRQTFATELLWRPLNESWELDAVPADHPGQILTMPPKLFEHRAVLFTLDNKPIAEVHETYTSENLAFPPPQ